LLLAIDAVGQKESFKNQFSVNLLYEKADRFRLLTQ
jgi:hypothetical protein